MDPRLPRLVRLAELVEARDTAALAELAAEARTIEAEIARLRDTSPPSEPEAFMLGGHGALWDSWRQRELECRFAQGW